MVLCVTISTYKWQRILSIHSIQFNFAKLHQYYLTALSFNNFLPSNVGGDTYRVYKTLKNPISKTAALVAVIFERITGIWALILFGFIGSVVTYLQKPLPIPHFDAIIIILGLAVIGPAIAFLMSGHLKFLLRIKFIPGKIIKFFQILNDYRRNGKDALQIIFISFFFHIFTFFWMMLLIRAIGTDCSIFSLALAVTISNLIKSLSLT